MEMLGWSADTLSPWEYEVKVLGPSMLAPIMS